MPSHSPGIVIAFLIAASCSPPAAPPAPVRDRAVQAGIAKALRTDSDAAIVAAHPKLMSRLGGTLTVGGQAFVDEGDCEEGDCTRYRADGVWQGRYVGIRVEGYEDSEYVLMTPNANPTWYQSIGARPEPSPSGRLFFAGAHDDNSQGLPLSGAAVWEFEGPHRLRVVDTQLVAFARFTAWRGETCVEFVGARGFNKGLQPEQTYWLAEQDGDWRLMDARPRQCR